MVKNSKNKGNNYERKLAKVFTEYWGTDFYRVPASGALHSWSADMNVGGDVTTSPSAGFPFVIEAKNRNTGDWTLESVLLNVNDVHNWLKQVIADSRRVERVPMLVFTRNRAKDFVMLPYYENIYESLVSKKHVAARTAMTYTDELSGKDETFDVIITTLDGFTSYPTSFWKKFDFRDWEEKTRLSRPITEDTTTVEDLISKIH